VILLKKVISGAVRKADVHAKQKPKLRG